MSNKRMSLSSEGKEVLDKLVEILDIDRPLALKISMAKGLMANGEADIKNDSITKNNKNKWTIPDNIIKNNDYLLFKHLIISEQNKIMDDEELNRYMLHYIETGLNKIEEEFNNKSSMEDIRITIL